MHTLASGRPLGTGDYKDASRPLRRLLKQYGDGSLEGGLRWVAAHPAAQSETIALLSVDKPVRAATAAKRTGEHELEMLKASTTCGGCQQPQ